MGFVRLGTARSGAGSNVSTSQGAYTSVLLLLLFITAVLVWMAKDMVEVPERLYSRHKIRYGRVNDSFFSLFFHSKERGMAELSPELLRIFWSDTRNAPKCYKWQHIEIGYGLGQAVGVNVVT